MKKPIPFGKYYLLDRIAVGGMAEVFKAKVIREEGFEKFFAIKRILPSIAEDEEFIKMFIDEAKIAVQLTHSNIVPIIDLGRVGDAYFIAMEYVHGKDLRTTVEKLAKKKETLPIPACCYIIMQVCSGLDYAHNKKDAAGRDLNLVHRDVSPHNILISFDGEVKLIDFGIAKAASKAAKTQAGILKGKFGYMSPEQVRDLPIDRRSDIFSAGIVLYEILTGERLFVGESDFSVLEKVKNVEIIPPSTYNKNIPEDLERIVLKALAREVQDRYQTAIEFHDDLQSFMYTYGSFFSRKEMSGLMRSLFPEDYEADMKEMESARISIPPGGGGKASTPPPPKRISAPPPPPPVRKSRVAPVSGIGSVPPPPPSRSRTSLPPPPVPKKTMIGMPGPSLPSSMPSPVGQPVQYPPSPQMQMQGGFEQGQSPAPPVQSISPKPATIPPARPPVVPPTPAIAQESPPEVRFTYPVTVQTAPPAPQPRPSTQQQQAPSGGISIEWEDDEMETQIYDKPDEKGLLEAGKKLPSMPAAVERQVPAPEVISSQPQAGVIPAPKGVKLNLVLGILVTSVVIIGVALIVLLVALKKEKATLVVVPEPREATVKIDGSKIESEYPPTITGLKPGKHTLIVSAENYETKVIELNLSGGQNTQVVNLIRKKAGGTGLSLETEPIGASIFVDGKPYPDRTPVRIVDLKPGLHTIRVEKENYLPYTTEIELREGDIINIPKVVLSPKAINASITSIPDDAKVYLIRDGEKKYVGKTPYQGTLDPSGSYSVEVEKEKYETWRSDVKFQPGSDKVTILAQLVEAGKGSPVEQPEEEKGKTHHGRVKRPKDGGGTGGGGGTGFLSVSTQPWTIVYIDGQKIRNTPLINYPLPSGQHKVRLINTQFNINQSYTVIIVSGQVTKIIKNLAQ